MDKKDLQDGKSRKRRGPYKGKSAKKHVLENLNTTSVVCEGAELKIEIRPDIPKIEENLARERKSTKNVQLKKTIGPREQSTSTKGDQIKEKSSSDKNNEQSGSGYCDDVVHLDSVIDDENTDVQDTSDACMVNDNLRESDNETGNANEENEQTHVDEEIDDFIFKIIQDEAKARNGDLLADEDVCTVYDPVTVSDFCERVSDNIHQCIISDENAKQEETNSEEQQVYQGSPYKLGVVVLLICCYVIRFRLPDEAISYLLRILVCILPHGHHLMGSLYMFRKFLRRLTDEIVPKIFYCCNNCYEEVEKQSKSCPSCRKSLTNSGSVAYFLQLRICSQLVSLWKNIEFCDYVRSHRFRHFETNVENKLFDIYDGQLYKNHFKNNGILKNENNLSFSLNTDGAPLFKSSNISIWPVYLLINELPLAQRKKRQFSLFYGVWISTKKPQMWSFLKPLYNELKELETDGCLFTDYSGTEFTCKCILLTCTCDLPARAIVYNLNQFNGQYSCWHCLQPGETFRHDSGGVSHIFPFDVNQPKGEARTDETVRKDTQEALDNVMSGGRTPATVHGHKGKFWFMYLNTFDVINSCVIDYMHGVCLGAMKQLLTLWFDKKNKDQSFSHYNERETINRNLLEIKPTLFVTRIPRTLDDLTHWKSSEYRNFLLYWGTPILQCVLRTEFFVHFCLLARSIFLLSKEGITEMELHTAENALFIFVEMYAKLYDKRYMTLNIHQLVHLTDCVRQTGPLYVNNCFIFEDLNGFIIKHIHGTQGVDTQITNIISMLKVPPLLQEKFLKSLNDEEVHGLYNDLIDSVGRHKYTDEIEDGVCPIGKACLKEIRKEHSELALKCGICKTSVKCFDRINMFKKGFYVYSVKYDRLQKRQQNIVTYKFDGNLEFGAVLEFLQSDEQLMTVNVAVVKRYRKVESIGCVWAVEECDVIDFVPLSCITNVNNFVVVKDKKYICPSPNRYDRD